MGNKIKIAGRLVLAIVLCVSFAQASPASCTGQCEGLCADRPGHSGMPMAQASAETRDCCSGQARTAHPCCNVENEPPSSGPQFVLSHFNFDPCKSPQSISVRFESEPLARSGDLSKKGTDFKRARPSPLYLKNLSFLC